MENSDRKGNYNKDEKKDINIPPKVYMMEKKNKSYVLIEVVKKTEYDQILKEYKKKIEKKENKKNEKNENEKRENEKNEKENEDFGIDGISEFDKKGIIIYLIFL